MPHSIQITETSPLLHDANCIYCHVDLELGDHAVVCESCRSPHHADCWQANGSRCSMFGCQDSGAAIQPAARRELPRPLGRRVVTNRPPQASRRRIGRRVVINQPQHAVELPAATRLIQAIEKLFNVILSIIAVGLVWVIMGVAVMLMIYVYHTLRPNFLAAVAGALMVLVPAILLGIAVIRIAQRRA